MSRKQEVKTNSGNARNARDVTHLDDQLDSTMLILEVGDVHVASILVVGFLASALKVIRRGE